MNIKKAYVACLKLLFVAIAAWFISGWITAGISHLNPIYFHAYVKSDTTQTLILFTSKNGQFSNHSSLRAPIKNSKKYRAVVIPVPPHRAAHLRLGFGNHYGILHFEHMDINGHPLDLVEASHYQMRNVRSCDLLEETNEISCRVAGEQAYITIPPDQLAPAIPTTSYVVLRIVLFLLSLACLISLYKRYHKWVDNLLSTYYPTWAIVLLLILVIYSYSSVLWYSFSTRLNAVFMAPAWPQFLLLLQEHGYALAFLLAGPLVSFICKNKYLKSFVLILTSIVLFTEILDLALLQLLNARFSPEQLTVFGSDSLFTAGPFIKSYLKNPAGKYILLTVLCWGILCLYTYRHTLNKHMRQLLKALAILSFIWYLIPSALTPAEQIQLHDWPRLYLRTLLPAEKNELRAEDFQLNYQCQKGLNSQQNIIIVLIESLSSYMSQYFSNGRAENWTPQLDKLARKYIAFTNYHTTSPDTTQSLFSIFTGIPAIHYYAESNLYREPKFFHHTIAKIFRKAGYHTALLSSASFVYSKDYILQNTKFDELSKDTDPFYNGRKRFVFHSVSDDVLYERVEKWISDYDKQKPYLLVVETTTTHNPFIDPESGEESVEKTFRYADKALGKFIDNLTKKNLLHNTLLVITSDHRTMLPMTDNQPRIFGPEAESSIPFVIIGSPLTSNQTVTSSHLDLVPSLQYLTLPEACFHEYQHNLFSTDKQRNSCTLFQSFVEKHKVLTNCQGQHAQIILSKDTNRIMERNIPAEQKTHLLSFINWIRDNNRY